MPTSAPSLPEPAERPAATAATVRPPPPGTCRLCGRGGGRRRFAKGGKTFLRCAGCGFLWLEPLPTAADLELHYRWTYAEGPYSVFAAAEDVRALIARERLSALADALPRGRWLDVGASTGAFVAAAREAGIDARGIELSESATRAARTAGLPVENVRLEDLDPDELFAAVTAFDTIEHLLDPAALLERARRWLAPGGLLALTLPDIGSPAARILGRWWYFYAPKDHFHYFDRHTIARLLDTHGFAVERIAPAYKPLTLEYVARQIEVFYAGLEPLARALRRLPSAWLARTVRVPVGEMLVLARRDG
jgi:SAM-dependent methyltransferase